MGYVAGRTLPNDILVFQLNARSDGNWGIAIFRDHGRGSERVAVVYIKLEPEEIKPAARRIARLAHLKLVGEPTRRKVGHHQFKLK
ncbi:hypothetical protein D4R51_01325 [bacterium]|nr:MAG: hypothetical protein D4R51_01325 [bacterium]